MFMSLQLSSLMLNKVFLLPQLLIALIVCHVKLWYKKINLNFKKGNIVRYCLHDGRT